MKVVIIDDHEVSCIGVKEILESNGYQVIGSFSSPDKALKFIEKNPPCFIIIDLRLGSQSGLELGKKIKKRWPAIKIILFSGFFRDVSLAPEVKTYFDGCVLKDEPIEDIIKALKAAEKGEFFISPLLEKAMTEAEKEILTPRDREILKLMKNGLTVKEASKRLFLSESTIKTHLRSIYQKLKVANRAQAVSKAIEKGYLELE